MCSDQGGNHVRHAAEGQRANASSGSRWRRRRYLLMGVIGALVFFWGKADSLGGRFAAVFEALVWPGFVVYGALRMLLT